MYYVINERDGKEVFDASMNLATSAYIVNELKLDQPVIYFSIHQPTVMIGKYQNAYAEVDQQYLEQNQITLLRRISGGGAVYHDLGNIMFVQSGDNDGFAGQKRYPEYSKPLIDALTGIVTGQIQATGRNDLTINGQKFSGTSFYATRERYMFGATISYDLNRTVAEKVLKPNQTKLKAHRIQSVKSRITNLKEYLPASYQSWTSCQFRDYLVCQLFGVARIADTNIYTLTEADWARIDQIKAEKFDRHEWNWGKNSDFTIENHQRFSSGTYQFQAMIEQGRMVNPEIYGDFFAKKDIAEIADRLKGLPYEPAKVRKVLETIELTAYIEGLQVANLMDLLFNHD